MSIVNPYIDTELETTITLQPNQGNNNAELYMMENLKLIHNKRIFQSYGYICEIYGISRYEGGIVQLSNPIGSSTFNVIFRCRLCIPLLAKKEPIMCKIDKIITTETLLISASNGPIKVLIRNNINPEKFKVGKMIYGLDNVTKKFVLLKQGDYVKVLLLSYKYNANDEIITCFGELMALATDEEIKQHINDEFENKENYVKYEDYVKSASK